MMFNIPYDRSIRITSAKKHRPGAKNKKRYFIVHDTASSASTINNAKFLAYNQSSWASAHILVGPDHIWELASDDTVTHHAGKGYFDGRRDDMNRFAIGMEVHSNDANKPWFTYYQLERGTKIIVEKMRLYEIPGNQVIRHSDYSSTGKTDIRDSYFKPQFKSWKEYQDYLQRVAHGGGNFDKVEARRKKEEKKPDPKPVKPQPQKIDHTAETVLIEKYKKQVTDITKDRDHRKAEAEKWKKKAETKTPEKLPYPVVELGKTGGVVLKSS